MYIEHPGQKNDPRPVKKNTPEFGPVPDGFNAAIQKKASAGKSGRPAEMLPPPQDMLLKEHSEDVLAHWKAPEYEVFDRDRKWYFLVTFILAAIVAWALYTNSPVMAILFILIGVVGYMHINRDPGILDFMITKDGVVVDREIYEFETLKSFWIFYEPGGKKAISLHTESHFLPYVHIPIHEENPVHLREILLEHIEEEKHEPGLVETMERLLKI